MNAVIVLNLNRYLHPVAQESMEAACRRWACEFVTFTEPILHDGRNVHPFWQKTLIPDRVREYERVLVLDGDMLIRVACPNPFQLVPEEQIGVVSRVQPGSPRGHTAPNSAKASAKHFGLEPFDFPEQHLNGGFVLYSPEAHADVLAGWRRAAVYCGFRLVGKNDQAALSFILHRHQELVHWLSWQFNCIWAKRDKRIVPYIYHFCGMRPAHRARAMESHAWR